MLDVCSIEFACAGKAGNLAAWAAAGIDPCVQGQGHMHMKRCRCSGGKAHLLGPKGTLRQFVSCQLILPNQYLAQQDCLSVYV